MDLNKKGHERPISIVIGLGSDLVRENDIYRKPKTRSALLSEIQREREKNLSRFEKCQDCEVVICELQWQARRNQALPRLRCRNRKRLPRATISLKLGIRYSFSFSFFFFFFPVLMIYNTTSVFEI